VLESAELQRGIAEVRTRIDAAAARAGRRPEEVRLIGVTKKVPPEMVRRAAEAGLTEFGENYVQELAQKRQAAPDATWHFIGRLQGNKVQKVLDTADLVQTVEPGRAADRLATLAAEGGRSISCLVEIDFSGSRVGASPGEAETFVERLQALPGIDCRGLMTVAPLGEDPRRSFGALRELRDRLLDRFPGVIELSMGMSEDLEAAVEEGATMVRVGTAIFGPRP
jgi:pyridoxal phosphate enzyme (YggS family)